jgi:DNA adenine methylase
MTDQGHRALAELLNNCKAKVVLSGYPSGLYCELYRRWRRVEFDIANHAAGGASKCRQTECLWMNYRD